MNGFGRKEPRPALILAVMVFGVFSLPGCVPAPSIKTGALLPKETVDKIQPGKTTRAEVLEWFGLPMGMGGKGETLTILGEDAWTAGGGIRKRGYYQVDTDEWFELFSTKHNIADYHRIYYYYYSVSSKYGVVIIVPLYESEKLQIDRLWLLINEETGIVEDYAFKKGL